MTDRFTRNQRSRCMSRIRGKDTSPELIVRKLTHKLGFRYRLHQRKLPGTPDIVFASRRKVVLVHGCFWHRHSCRKGRSMPSTRREFWQKKLEGNKARDGQNRRALRRLGWGVLVVWECQTRPEKIEKLMQRIVTFLES